MKRGLALVLGAALGLAPGTAAASPFSVEGFGPTGVAEINARAARADDGTATFYNPGGLGLGSGTRTEISPTLGVSALSAQHQTLSLEAPFGIAFAFDATIPFEGALKDRVRFGFGNYLLPTGLIRIVAHPESQPSFPYFDNRTQRLVLLPALAVKILPNLAIGGGIDVLGGVSGPARVDVGPSGAPESRIDIDATTRAAAVLGVRFDPTPKTHLGVTFRQRFSVPASVDTSAVVGGVPLAVSVNAAENLFDPDTLVVAAAFDFDRLGLEIDASYAAWSAYQGPFVKVHAELPAVNIDASLPKSIAKDVVSLRGAASYRFDIGRHALILHGGLGFEPSMLRAPQQGRSNLLDGDKLLVGLGASFEIKSLLGKKLRLGLGLSSDFVFEDTQTKIACTHLPCSPNSVPGPDPLHPSANITNPGYPKLEGGGAFLSGAFGIGVEL